MARKRAEIPSALKLKTCNSKVRKIEGKDVVHAKCPGEWLGDKKCPNMDMHLLPFPSGKCNSGWHEGSKATDWRGKPAPTCTLIYTCPCKCHDDLWKMFAMTGQERVTLEVSGYVPPHRDYWLPSDDPDYNTRISTPVGGTPPIVIESPAPDVVPPTVIRDFAPTESGRTPKGQLEVWVKKQCDIWLIDKPGFPCTPQWVSSHIATDEGVSPPSVGAVSAVFDRWIGYGFAVIEKKPTRFIKYTEEGLAKGLERLKIEHKRSKKMSEAERIANLRRA